MSWTTPRTWTTGEVVTAAMMNAHVRDNMNVLATAIDTSNGKVLGVSLTYFTSLATISQTINSQQSIVFNSGSSETTLFTYTLPGGTLAAGSIRITAWGSAVNTANVKTVRQYFGAQIGGVGGISTVPASTTAAWFMRSVVARTGAATQATITIFSTGPANANETNATTEVASPAQTLSGSIVIKTTGQSAASNDISASGQIVELLNS